QLPVQPCQILLAPRSRGRCRPARLERRRAGVERVERRAEGSGARPLADCLQLLAQGAHLLERRRVAAQRRDEARGACELARAPGGSATRGSIVTVSGCMYAWPATVSRAV